MSQTLELTNDIDIEYTSTLSEIDEAILTIKKGEELIATRDITTSDYTETFEDMFEGIYTFELKNNDLINTKEIIIPDYESEWDISNLDTDITQGEEKRDVVVLFDKNPEHMPVTFGEINVINGNVTATTNEYEIIRQGGEPNATSPYNLSFELVNALGDTTTKNLEGILHNLIDFSLKLEDCETDTAKSGLLMAYDSNQGFLGAIPISEEGFNFTFPTRIPEVKFQFGLMDYIKASDYATEINSQIEADIIYESFVRTIVLDGTKDYPDLIVRVSSYEGLDGITPQKYKTHMNEVNFGEWPPGLKQFDWENLQGIEIENQHAGGEEFGTFTQEKQGHYEEKILDPNDIGYFLHGRTINIQLNDIDSERHYDKYGEGEDAVLIPHDGWIVIAPDNNLPGAAAGLTSHYDTDNDGKVDRVRILLQDQGDAIFTKEMTRALLCMTGNSTVLSSSQTIMVSSPTLLTPSSIDERSSHDIDEPTYEPFEDDDILGLEFLPFQ